VIPWPGPQNGGRPGKAYPLDECPGREILFEGRMESRTVILKLDLILLQRTLNVESRPSTSTIAPKGRISRTGAYSFGIWSGGGPQSAQGFPPSFTHHPRRNTLLFRSRGGFARNGVGCVMVMPKLDFRFKIAGTVGYGRTGVAGFKPKRKNRSS